MARHVGAIDGDRVGVSVQHGGEPAGKPVRKRPRVFPDAYPQDERRAR
jgi:hypothetical protein